MSRLSPFFIVALLLMSIIIPLKCPQGVCGSDHNKPTNSIWGPQDISSSFKYDERNSGQSPYNVSSNPGDLVWRFDTGSYVRSQIFMDANETSLVSNTEKLFVIDRNGMELMNISSGDNISFRGMPVKDGYGNIYVGSMNFTDRSSDHPWYRNSSLYSFYPNGSLRWEIMDDGIVGFNPIIYRNRIFFMSSRAAIYCAFLNGTLDWKYTFNMTSGYTHSLAFDSVGNIYFTGCYDQLNGAIFSLAFNGTYRWNYDILSPGPAPTISSNDTIYINEGTTLHSFHSSGSLNWKKAIIPGNIDDIVVRDDGSLLINCVNTIHCLFENSTTNWTKSFSSPVYSDLVTSNDGYMVLITSDIKLRVLDPDRQEVFTYTPDDYSHIAPIIGTDGDIYFGGDDGVYYKIGKAVPSPPRNLTGYFRDVYVILEWAPPRFDGGIGIDEYRIYRGEEGSKEIHIASVDGTFTTYNDTQVENGREYSYYLIAVNVINMSFPSNIVIGIPSGFADPPVVKRVWNEEDSINFEWAPPFNWGGTEILLYRLYRSMDNQTFDPIVLIPRAYVSYADHSVEPGELYYYYFRTKNKNGEGPPGPIIKITHLEPPSVPLNFRGIGGDGFVDLYWAPPAQNGGSEILEYSIVKLTNTTDFIHIYVDGQTHSYHDENVTNGIDYYYTMRAVNDQGCSNPTEEIKVTPLAPPLPPENLTIERSGNNAILKWDLPSEEEGPTILYFNIYRRFQVSSFELVAQVDAGSISYTEFGIINGSSYEFYLTSVSMVGESIPSNTVSLEVVHLSVTVELLSVELENGTILIEYEAIDLENLSLPTDPDPGFQFLHYNLYKEDPTGEFQILSGTNATSYRDRDFSYGIMYTYYVTLSYMLYNAWTEGPPSERMAITPITLPDPPTLVEAISKDGGAEIWWDPPVFNGGAPISGYRIMRTSPSQGTGVMYVSYQMHYILENVLLNGETYTYSIYSLNSVGPSATALVLEVTPLGLPSAPLNLTYDYYNGNVTLRWNPPDDDGGSEILEYLVFMGPSPDSMVLHSKMEGDHLEFAEVMGKDEVRYYRVAASNDVGMGESTGLLKVDTTDEEVVDDGSKGTGIEILLIVSLVIFIVVSVISVLWMMKRRGSYQIEE